MLMFNSKGESVDVTTEAQIERYKAEGYQMPEDVTPKDEGNKDGRNRKRSDS